MAQQKIATLIGSEHFGDETKLLSFRMADLELGFIGGQYIIVDTGIPIPGNKIAKRAYSILSADAEQREFQLGVRRIGHGPGSNFMHDLQVEAALGFSGPWGKFVAPDSFVAPDKNDELLVVATDTGITAALGLLKGQGLLAARERSKLIWFAESERYFLPFNFVISQLDRIGIRNLAVTETAPISDPTRIETTLLRIDQAIAPELPKAAFLCGDGAVVHAVRNRLIGAGVSNENIRIECFFNNPERKAAA
jgi:ferredoxin-NADP reductase